MEKLRDRVGDTEQMLEDAQTKLDEMGEVLDAFEEASVWQTRFGALLAAVRDLGRENDELKSVANDLCSDIPEDALPFGMLYTP